MSGRQDTYIQKIPANILNKVEIKVQKRMGPFLICDTAIPN